MESAVLPEPSTDPGQAWTAPQRVGFRVLFVYFAMFAAASLLDSGPAPRALLEAMRAPVVGWVGRSVFNVGQAIDSVSVRRAVAQQLSAIAVAVAIALVWSSAARRTEYRRLFGWLRILLRYYLGIVMLVYGGFKVIDSQFPPAALDQLAAPLGSLTPMGLLWTYMAYSPVYTAFTGLGESAGAFLLFFRRTTTAGALILVAVLSNVALINYVYDVPVKQLSTNLLIAAIVLAAADGDRLVSTLFLNRPTAPASPGIVLSIGMRRARSIVRPIVIAGATCIPIVASFFVHRNLMRVAPLAGVYDIERFARNGISMAPFSGDSLRWRRVIFSSRGALFVRMVNDSTRTLTVSVDTARGQILTLAKGQTAREVQLQYRHPSTDVMELSGRFAGDSVDVTLRRLDERKVFRLLAP